MQTSLGKGWDLQMMVSMESFLLRARRRREKWSDAWLDRMQRIPKRKKLETGIFYFSGAFLLSALRVWGQMQPVAIGLALAGSGWRGTLAALGSAAGYRIFFGTQGQLGMLWSLAGAALALALHLAGENRPLPLAAAGMGLTAAVELALQTGAPPGLFTLRILLAGLSVLLFRQAALGGDRLSRWGGAGILTMSLAGIRPWAGRLCSGAAAAALPLPAAAIVSLGAELGGESAVSLVGVACITFFLQRLFPRESWRRMAAPGIGCGLLMLVQQVWDPGLLLAVGLGGAAGAMIPARFTVTPRRSRVGAAQVRLEQAARVMTAFQRQLLEYAPPGPDLPAVTEQLKRNTCLVCTSKNNCPDQERLGPEALNSGEPFPCKRGGIAAVELRRSREQVKRIKANRARQQEYRMALVQQYGYLAQALHDLADRLPQGESRPESRFRVKVSARSRSRELEDGDRVAAFPGLECRYYVVLCDGMGTGPEASEESRGITELMRRMLVAGLSPETALGSVNSQLALTDRGGAVTIDLLELRLDSGRAMLYKWGAGQSWLLRRRRAAALGASGPPPGLGVTAGRESTVRTGLSRGETLVMLSDGVGSGNAARWAEFADNMEPGSLAKQILDDGGNPEDDATAVVVRLERKDAS